MSESNLLMIPLIEVNDVPGTTSWCVTLRGTDKGVGISKFFDGPNAKEDADAFVMQALRVVQEADSASKGMV